MGVYLGVCVCVCMRTRALLCPSPLSVEIWRPQPGWQLFQIMAHGLDRPNLLSFSALPRSSALPPPDRHGWYRRSLTGSHAQMKTLSNRAMFHLFALRKSSVCFLYDACQASEKSKKKKKNTWKTSPSFGYSFTWLHQILFSHRTYTFINLFCVTSGAGVTCVTSVSTLTVEETWRLKKTQPGNVSLSPLVCSPWWIRQRRRREWHRRLGGFVGEDGVTFTQSLCSSVRGDCMEMRLLLWVYEVFSFNCFNDFHVCVCVGVYVTGSCIGECVCVCVCEYVIDSKRKRGRMCPNYKNTH